MGPPLDNFAVVDDQNLVGVANRAEAVGDDKTGATGHEATHGFLDVIFGARIDAAGGFVENQDTLPSDCQPDIYG